MKKRQAPKKHHFVPRWYLANFINPSNGFLEVYDKSKNVWRRQKPGEAMVVNNYYRQLWAPKGTDVNILETILGESLEPNAKQVVEKIINREEFTQEDVETLIAYIEFQRIRVPREAARVKQLREALLMKFIYEHPELTDIAAELKKGTIRVEIQDSVRFDYMKTVIGVFSSVLPHMIWEVVCSEDDSSFLTTDCPVTLVNPSYPPPLEPGIKLVGTTVFLPLSPKYLLILNHPANASSSPPPPYEPVEYPKLEEGTIEVDIGRILPVKAVRRINWFMYQLAHKYIVADSKSVIEAII